MQLQRGVIQHLLDFASDDDRPVAGAAGRDAAACGDGGAAALDENGALVGILAVVVASGFRVGLARHQIVQDDRADGSGLLFASALCCPGQSRPLKF